MMVEVVHRLSVMMLGRVGYLLGRLLSLRVLCTVSLYMNVVNVSFDILLSCLLWYLHSAACPTFPWKTLDNV